MTRRRMIECEIRNARSYLELFIVWFKIFAVMCAILMLIICTACASCGMIKYCLA